MKNMHTRKPYVAKNLINENFPKSTLYHLVSKVNKERNMKDNLEVEDRQELHLPVTFHS